MDFKFLDSTPATSKLFSGETVILLIGSVSVHSENE